MSVEYPRILVIDDDPDNFDLLSNWLKKREYTVLFASDGTSGIQQAIIDQPDLILLDILMPGIDGFETCRQLKTSEKTRDIPVIFMTALSNTVDKVKGFECGAIDFITKPIDPDEVLARVNAHLSIQKLHKTLYSEIQELSEKYTAASKQLEELRLNLSRTLPHELRTPLNAILGFSRFLMSLGPEQLPETENILDVRVAIHDSALRLQHLIENYLLYANLQLMKYDPEKRKFQMWKSKEMLQTKPVVASVVLSKAERSQRKADLRLDLVDAEIRISERSFLKIVDELIDNALKFSKPGTPVHVTTEVKNDQWILTIADQGRGMTPEQIMSIGAYMQFERRHYEQQGSGLGLAIALLLTKLNEGELTIESLPKQGTSVIVGFNRKKGNG